MMPLGAKSFITLEPKINYKTMRVCQTRIGPQNPGEAAAHLKCAGDEEVIVVMVEAR
jgi:hypothetical protein